MGGRWGGVREPKLPLQAEWVKHLFGKACGAQTATSATKLSYKMYLFNLKIAATGPLVRFQVDFTRRENKTKCLLFTTRLKRTLDCVSGKTPKSSQ